MAWMGLTSSPHVQGAAYLSLTTRAATRSAPARLQLANYVQTENFTSPVAPLRREWFITYVSRDKSVNPLATACSDVLTPQQVATYTQVGDRRPALPAGTCLFALPCLPAGLRL